MKSLSLTVLVTEMPMGHYSMTKLAIATGHAMQILNYLNFRNVFVFSLSKFTFIRIGPVAMSSFATD